MKLKETPLLVLAAGLLALVCPASTSADGATTAKPDANLELARQLNQAFVQVAEEVSPSVVVITVLQRPGAALTGAGNNSDEAPADQLPPELRRFMQRGRTTGEGSGVIIRRRRRDKN